MKLKDTEKALLEIDKTYRNSDKKLIWKLWKMQKLVTTINGYEYISYGNFMEAMSPSSILRAKRKVVAENPHLGSDKHIQKMKDKKEATKGEFIESLIL